MSFVSCLSVLCLLFSLFSFPIYTLHQPKSATSQSHDRYLCKSTTEGRRRQPSEFAKLSSTAINVKVVTKDDFEEELRRLEEFGGDILKLLDIESNCRLESDRELEERKYAFFSDGP